jgi:endonuclease/exonuclease/phosphatase family metal-dependent hydrolase
MARSGNRNVTADIAAALNMHAWFAPAYLNLTAGHGAERAQGGENHYGLHGNSILSRYPLSNLRVVRLKNATDKFRSIEVRLGQQTALLADLKAGSHAMTLGCVHLDAYSSQRQRARQMLDILRALPALEPVVIGGDFNTSTYNARHTVFTALGLIYKTLFFGPERIMRNHYVHPYKRFDRPVFRVLEKYGFDYRNCNELGVGTFDIVLGDESMRAMASDKFPRFVQKYVEWAVGLNGGGCSTRLDWFAAKNITPCRSHVVRLSTATFDALPNRVSDHHPIMMEFQIAP